MVYFYFVNGDMPPLFPKGISNRLQGLVAKYISRALPIIRLSTVLNTLKQIGREFETSVNIIYWQDLIRMLMKGQEFGPKKELLCVESAKTR